MQFKIVDQWNSFLDKIPENKKDIYYTEEYTKLYENKEDVALCIVSEEGNDVILMPFIRREIRDKYDFETAYGYGGPITNSDSWEWIEKSLQEMKDCFTANGYICGFIRFHPMLDNALACKEVLNVIYDRKTVSVDMRQSIEDIWSTQISSKNRNMIRKAEKNGLSYRAEYDFANMKEFINLYNETMQRLGADDFYYFQEEYFKSFADDLKGNSFLGVVSKDEQPVGAALFMYTGEYGHYHLAGSDRKRGSLGINNYLLWKTIEELNKKGIKRFHLGGGTTSSPDDSLYKFKKAFGMQENEFYVGKWIFNKEIYDDVCDEWMSNYPDLKERYGHLLLKYRYRT